MSNFLKLDVVLPPNPNYLILSQLELPPSVANIGSVAHATKLQNKLMTMVGTSSVIGNLTYDETGATVGANGYINTHTDDALQQTLIVVAMPLISAGSHLALSNFLSETIATSGKAGGLSLTHAAGYYPNVSQSAMANTPLNGELNTWSILAVSRNSGSYSFVSRKKGAISNQITVTGYADLQAELQAFCIGGSLTMGNYAANVNNHSKVALSAIHNKALTQTELVAYVNALAADMNAINASYNL
ncbi:hypothetical protein R4446_06110 [Acinetobacter baumannii]|uniref:Uncharacterized protein n=1 Tax=Acinetobacter baumannii 21072 TaxID=1310697 RepID=A0A062IUN9_ACIBA|nr:hypothetical protein [Acinetobacter baumannii]KCY21593.1 hypothetical protein J596_0620 [Acinetobacter baumannii 21072]MDV7387236.1 hypothetical protein [Acinetobacter baumannii]